MAPRKQAPSGPKPVVSTSHDDKRPVIPTADVQDLVPPEVEEPVKVRWPRDHSLDPQLVWKGKDEEADVLEGDAPPLYIQEKIDPRVLVENLRRSAKAGEVEPELTLFDTFDGLEGMDNLDFYDHSDGKGAKWSNRMILGDSLNVMASLAERERLRGKVQMVYIDPPYGIKFGSNWQVSARKRDVKDGGRHKDGHWTDATREVEQIKAFRDTWELGINTYLSYLRDRLLAAHDLLASTGSCFVQIGDENVHLVRSLMDEVFGSENFVSVVVVRKTTSEGASLLGSTADFIVWYARDVSQAKYRQLWSLRTLEAEGRYDQVLEADWTSRPATSAEKAGEALPTGAALMQLGDITSSRPARDGDLREFEYQDRVFRPGNGTFKTNAVGMQRVANAGRLQITGRGGLRYRRIATDFGYGAVGNLWADISGAVQSRSDPKVYVVQTSTAMVERCMLMCTEPGDLVIDPTCGSGTTAVVAEQWGRRWITIDTSRVALALARQRVMGAKFPYYLLADSDEGRLKEGQLTATALPPTTATNDIRHGFVYERVQHITLKSIANNPDIVEGMSREEVDAAIKKHAEFELLFDKPYEDKGKVRVTGPFTVESLSPHRSLAFAGGPGVDESQPKTEQVADQDPDAGDFAQMILDNLHKAGIQNGRRQERIELDTVEPYAGVAVHAVGTRKAADGDEQASPARVGISIGPEYGTVSAPFVKEAAREAIKAGDIDLLCILAFAFDANVVGATVDGATVETDVDDDFASVTAERKLGKVPVLLVRMNQDLVMGEELKKTGAGNLFTVFGQPDIEIGAHGDDLVITLHGVDVYDPTTGEVRSNDTSQIALWMIDSDYDGESFFVRHAYFTGGQKPFERLKKDLKAEINEEAWASLYRTVSRPFPKPSTGKIAVKVINDYGDEVLQVFEV